MEAQFWVSEHRRTAGAVWPRDLGGGLPSCHITGMGNAGPVQDPVRAYCLQFCSAVEVLKMPESTSLHTHGKQES